MGAESRERMLLVSGGDGISRRVSSIRGKDRARAGKAEHRSVKIVLDPANELLLRRARELTLIVR